jgi:hypothetical protein
MSVMKLTTINAAKKILWPATYQKYIHCVLHCDILGSHTMLFYLYPEDGGYRSSETFEDDVMPKPQSKL